MLNGALLDSTKFQKNKVMFQLHHDNVFSHFRLFSVFVFCHIDIEIDGSKFSPT